jgi:hypothetical protein
MIVERDYDLKNITQTGFFKESRKSNPELIQLFKSLKQSNQEYIKIECKDLQKKLYNKSNVKRWENHSIPKKYLDKIKDSNLSIKDGQLGNCTLWRATHSFDITDSLGFVAVCIFGEDYILTFLKDKENIKETEKNIVPEKYLKTLDSALTYLCIHFKHHFKKRSTYKDSNGNLKHYFRCYMDNYNKPKDQDKCARKRKVTKENISCNFSFNILESPTGLQVNITNSQHTHTIDDTYASNFILPIYQNYLASNCTTPLCLIDKPTVSSLIKTCQKEHEILKK